MTDQDKRTAALLLEWSRTIVVHGLSWEEWIIRRARGSR